MLIVLGGAATAAFAFALLALDRWQRAPLAPLVESVEPEPEPVEPELDEPDDPEPEPIVCRRGAHREARTARARLAATWSGVPAVHIGRRRSLLRGPARKSPAVAPDRPLVRGRASRHE